MKLTLQMFFLLITVSINGQNLASYVDSIRVKNSMPEIGYAIINPDTILQLTTLGYHKFSDRDTATIKDLFHLGSNTKAMTAFVAAKLVEEGKINWATNFFDLFPVWKEESDPAYWQLSLQKLLSHRGKILPFTAAAEFKILPKFTGSKQEKRIQFCRFLLKQKAVKFNDSLSFTYSNAGYALAALMLEKVSGITWEDLVIKTFKADLGINVGFSWPNLTSANQPWGHVKVNDSIIALSPAIEASHDMNPIEPAGDIHISLSDYAEFIRLNLSGLSGKDNYLKSATYKFLHFDAEYKIYAMGWGNKMVKGKLRSYHNGSAGTFYARTVIDIASLTAYVVITNIATDLAIKGVDDIVEEMITKYSK
jgi:D-alanyl-D-alanine carboxypeptidase